jgi:hypothetical protein
MAPQAKTEALLVRMGEIEAAMLTDLSDHSGLSRADVIRQLIRREHKTVLPNIEYVDASSKEEAVAKVKARRAKAQKTKKR